MTRVAIYTRVSTSEQSTDMQTADLINYCKGRDWKIVASYSDTISGSKRSRPGLDQLMNDARRHMFDVVLVWKLDRFSRSLSHLILSMEGLEKLNIQFISLRDNLDMHSATGRAMFQLIGVFAELERGLIQERVKAGIDAARKRGVRLGRPRVFVSAANLVAARKQGLSWDRIAKDVGTPTTTIRRAARREGIK